MCERYECKLSPEALEKAIRELNEPEDNDARLAAIDTLRTRFQEEAKDLELIRSDDAFLLRFLRARKFDQDRALTTLINYHRNRIEWRELFDLVDNPKSIGRFLYAGTIVPLRNARAKDGSFVMLGRPGYEFQEKEDCLRYMAVGILTAEKSLENEKVQIYGASAIEDMANFGLTTAMQMTTYSRKYLHIWQDGMPVRLKSLNFVNEAIVMDMIYAIVSKFMKDKMKRRLQLHGTNFKTLHEKVDRSHLPFFLDGTGPDLNADWWANELLSTSGAGEDTAM